jgi:tetratricopeptide (TPR) repeat protein
VAANAATIKERDRAEKNLLGALAAVDGLLNILNIDRLAQVPHIDRTQAAMLEKALAVCDQLLAGQENNPRLRLFQAFTLQRSGKILTLLRRYTEAEERFDRALAILRAPRPDPQPADAAVEFAKLEAFTRLDRGKLFLRLGNAKRATEDYDAARAVVEAHGADPELKFLAAMSSADLGALALMERDTEGALLHLGRARQALEELFEEDSRDVAYVGVYAFVLNGLGVARMRKDETEHAAELFERGIKVSRELLKVIPGHREYRAELARCLANLGVSLRLRGHLKRAAEPLAEAQAIREELAGKHPEVTSFAVDLCWSYLQTGQLHRSRDDSRAADEVFTKGIGRLTKERGLLDSEPHARELAADLYQARAAARESLKLFKEAADDMGKAAEFAPADKRPALRVQRAFALVDAGEVEKAVAEVEGVLAKPDGLPAAVRFDAGVAFAKAAKAAKKPEQKEEYAARAVKELAAAEKGGHFRDPKRRTLLDDPAFAHLRGRDDFDALRARTRH